MAITVTNLGHTTYPQLDGSLLPQEVCSRAGAWRTVPFLNSSFLHFAFDMCFVRQPCALFHNFSFQTSQTATLKCSHILTPKCASSAWCHICVYFLSRSAAKGSPDLRLLLTLRLRHVLRHNHVQSSHPATWLRTRRFSEPTFQHFETPKHWKTRCFGAILPFRALSSSFFWLSFLWFFPRLLRPMCISWSLASKLLLTNTHTIFVSFVRLFFHLFYMYQSIQYWKALRST